MCKIYLTLGLLGLFLTPIRYTQATIHRVANNAQGSNNGTSWFNAFTTLEAALTAANPNDTIWVNLGTYKPGTTRGSSWALKPGIKIFGGFTGSETSLSQRPRLVAKNPWTYTTLSAEIGTSQQTDNCYHLFKNEGVQNFGGEIVIDGFVMEGAYANGPFGNDGVGGAILFNHSMQNNNPSTFKITLRNLIVHNNYAYTGSAFYITNGWNPGGTQNAYTSEVEIENCRIYNNTTNVNTTPSDGDFATVRILGCGVRMFNNEIVENTCFYPVYIQSFRPGRSFPLPSFPNLPYAYSIVHNTIANNAFEYQGLAASPRGLEVQGGVGMIANNIIYNNNGRALFTPHVVVGGTDTLYNNIIPRLRGINSGGTAVTFQQILTNANTVTNGNINSRPIFETNGINPIARIELMPNSPALGAGLPEGVLGRTSPSIAMNDTTRPLVNQAPDIGAHEFTYARKDYVEVQPVPTSFQTCPGIPLRIPTPFTAMTGPGPIPVRVLVGVYDGAGFTSILASPTVDDPDSVDVTFSTNGTINNLALGFVSATRFRFSLRYDTTYSNTFSVTVSQIAVKPTISIAGTRIEIPNPNSAYQVAWYQYQPGTATPYTLLSTTSGTSFTPPGPGQYVASYFRVDESTCKGPYSDPVTFGATGITADWNQYLKVYPNPLETGGTLILNWALQPTGKLFGKLINPNGQVVSTHSFDPALQMEWNLAELPSGLYLLQLELEGERLTRRILVR